MFLDMNLDQTVHSQVIPDFHKTALMAVLARLEMGRTACTDFHSMDEMEIRV